MLFYQLKILIWRNFVLKRRKPISTLLEIIIPILISLVIGIYFFTVFIYKKF